MEGKDPDCNRRNRRRYDVSTSYPSGFHEKHDLRDDSRSHYSLPHPNPHCEGKKERKEKSSRVISSPKN